ncbi:hypothetical protein AC1031_004912 [Aphanomyces cochlioides]|nr:hypothetical protein AC1031_004912 [Aphanomyces cochlioides]
MTRASRPSGGATATLSSSPQDYAMPIMDHSTYTPETNEPSCFSPHATSDSDLCGWLWMRSSMLGRWRHRYFSFAFGLLSYFESFPSEEFIKQTPLRPPMAHLLGSNNGKGSQPRGVLRVAHIEENSNKLGFKVYATSGKVIEIRAPRSDIRQTWLVALRATAHKTTRSWSTHQHRPQAKSVATRSTDPIHSGRQSIPVDKSGWLLKRSDFLRRWNRYYFVLQDRMLSYYTTDKPYDVPRRRGYIQAVRRDPKVPSLVVVTLSAGSELWLRLPSDQTNETLDAWFDSLQTTSALFLDSNQRENNLVMTAPSRYNTGSSDNFDSNDNSFI